jgi:hypothetical protein
MPEPREPLFGELRDQLGRLRDEAAEMLRLRWELAGLEIRKAADDLKRLAVAWSLAGAMGLVGLSVLAVAAGEALDGLWGIPRLLWLLIFGAGLSAAAGLVAWLAWRHFRRTFTGLEDTLEELREDAVWLGEWTGREEED